MTKDRTAALRAIQGEYTLVNMTKSDKEREEFFQQVTILQEEIEKLENNVIELKKVQNSIFTKIDNNALKQKHEDLMRDINSMSNKIRGKLKTIEMGINEVKNQTELRIRNTQYSMLSRKFLNLLTDYNLTQNEYRDKTKRRIQHELEITNNPVTEEQLDEMIENKNLAIFTQQHLDDTLKAKQSLNEIKARHQDLLMIEKSIKELHDLFLDIQLIVEAQGETLDLIENNIGKAADDVVVGNKELVQARINRAKARKKKICIYIILACVLLVLIFALFYSF